MMGRRCFAVLLLAVVLISGVLSMDRDASLQRRSRWTTVAVKCKDIGRKCGMLSRAGYCRLAPSQMATICMKSCNLCGKKRNINGWNIHMEYKGQK